MNISTGGFLYSYTLQNQNTMVLYTHYAANPRPGAKTAQWIRGIAAQKTSEHENRKAEIYRKEGAIRTLAEIAETFDGKVKTEATEAMEKLDKERSAQMIQQANLSAEISHFNGQLATCKLYMDHFVFTGETGMRI